MKQLLLIVLIFICSCSNERERYFPKERKIISELPSPQNLWIFVLAGQSNMMGVGRVEAEDTIPNPRILLLNKEMLWEEAKAPLHFYEPNFSGLGLGGSFARKLLPHLPDTVSIGLVPCAISGTSLNQWLHDKEYRGARLWSNLESRTSTAQQYGILKGILWHQGEADAPKQKEFKEKFQKLNAKFRNQFGQSFKLIVGELGAFSTQSNSQSWNAINSDLAELSSIENFELVPSEGLDHIGDSLHFNGPSQRIFGGRYAYAYLNLIQQ